MWVQQFFSEENYCTDIWVKIWFLLAAISIEKHFLDLEDFQATKMDLT